MTSQYCLFQEELYLLLRMTSKQTLHLPSINLPIPDDIKQIKPCSNILLQSSHQALDLNTTTQVIPLETQLVSNSKENFRSSKPVYHSTERFNLPIWLDKTQLLKDYTPTKISSTNLAENSLRMFK